MKFASRLLIVSLALIFLNVICIIQANKSIKKELKVFNIKSDNETEHLSKLK